MTAGSLQLRLALTGNNAKVFRFERVNGNNGIIFSKDLLTLEVKVGSTSLITPGPEEQKLPVLETQIYPDFDATTGLHNIALLQVQRFNFS